MSNINLNLYKIFCAVASSKSYSEASEKINLSVSNISTQIINLENQLDIKLFNRENNGVTLTEAGEQLYKYVSKGLLAVEYAEKLIKQNNELDTGKIRIACPSHICSYYLMPYIAKVKQDYPNFEVELICGSNPKEMFEILKNHQVDFIIIDVLPNETENLVIKRLKTINNIFISRKPLKINNINELENLKFILNFENTNSTKKLKEILNKYNINIHNNIASDITEVRVEAVKKELGIGYVIKEAVKEDLEKEELYEVEVPIELPSIDINLMYYKDRLSKVANKFIKEYLK